MLTQQSKLCLRPINIQSDEDLKFTYNLLLKRFAAKTEINIDNYELPSYEKHCAQLKGERYKYYYIVSYDSVEFMVLYLIRSSNEVGYFICPEQWQKILQANKDTLINCISDTPDKMTKPKKLTAFIIKQTMNLLLETHRELINTISAKVAYNNKFSHQVTKYCHLTPQSIRYKLNLQTIDDLNISSRHNIRALDVNNKYDIDFTYDLLQMRFNLEYINIKKHDLPSYNEHVENLKSGKYRYYYICSFEDIDILTMYVINKGPELGAFIHPRNFYQGIKKYPDHMPDSAINTATPDIPKSWQISAYHGKMFLNKILKAHPELLTTLESTVNYNNAWSKYNTEALGFNPAYIFYSDYTGHLKQSIINH
jgi:hypothetical protein